MAGRVTAKTCDVCKKPQKTLHRCGEKRVCLDCLQESRKNINQPNAKDEEYRIALRKHMGLAV